MPSSRIGMPATNATVNATGISSAALPRSGCLAMMTSGTTGTGVVPAPNVWYRFLVEVEDTGAETRIRAKVWEDGMPEPGAFQLDAVDDSELGAHYDVLMAKIEAVLRSRPSAEWIDVLHEAGVPVSLVKFPLELFDDPQAEAWVFEDDDVAEDGILFHIPVMDLGEGPIG